MTVFDDRQNNSVMMRMTMSGTPASQAMIWIMLFAPWIQSGSATDVGG